MCFHLCSRKNWAFTLLKAGTFNNFHDYYDKFSSFKLLHTFSLIFLPQDESRLVHPAYWMLDLILPVFVSKQEHLIKTKSSSFSATTDTGKLAFTRFHRSSTLPHLDDLTMRSNHPESTALVQGWLKPPKIRARSVHWAWNHTEDTCDWSYENCDVYFRSFVFVLNFEMFELSLTRAFDTGWLFTMRCSRCVEVSRFSENE